MCFVINGSALIGTKMFLFLGILLATIIIYILRFHYEFVRAIYLSMKIRGPRAYPIIGNGLIFMNNTSAGIVNESKQFLLLFCFFVIAQ